MSEPVYRFEVEAYGDERMVDTEFVEHPRIDFPDFTDDLLCAHDVGTSSFEEEVVPP